MNFYQWALPELPKIAEIISSNMLYTYASNNMSKIKHKQYMAYQSATIFTCKTV